MHIDCSGSFGTVARVSSVTDPFVAKNVVCVVEELYPAWNQVALHAYVLECAQPLRTVWKWYLNGDTRFDVWLETLETAYRVGWGDNTTVPNLTAEIGSAKLGEIYYSLPVVSHMAALVRNLASSIYLGHGSPDALKFVFKSTASHAVEHYARSFPRKDVFTEVYAKTVDACSELAVEHLRRHR
jgi:hypothetical protein